MKNDYSCVNVHNNFIQSPLNYTGGKYKLLPQIIPFFPKNINKFIDLFCGGANVGININCDYVQLNDRDYLLVGLLSTFKLIDRDKIFQIIEQIISDYGLSNSSEKGYKYYGCDSTSGLGSYNKAGYLRLRRDFNKLKYRDPHYYLTLYVLIVFSFNNQIRFNSEGKFNLPVGKRDFNKKMMTKLEDYVGAAAGGFAGGLAFVASGFNLGATFAVMGGTETLLTNLLTNATGRTNYSDLQILANTTLSLIMGLVSGRIFGGTKIIGKTIGSNSFKSIWKSGLTKLANPSVLYTMSLKTIAKGVAGVAIMRSSATGISGLVNSGLDWFQRILGNMQGVGYF